MNKDCNCRKCLQEREEVLSFGIGQTLVTMEGRRYASHGMIVCPKCGNKRCPHATDHSYECTNSNEPGQKGSVYQ